MKNFNRFDYIVIGAGHNGLVCAAYLAKTGKRVLVLEKRSILGGSCTTEAIFKNCKVSRAAYVLSLFHPQIISDLALKSFHLTLLKRDPSSISLFKNKQPLILGSDLNKNIKSIERFSQKDAKVYSKYLNYLESIVSFVDNTLTMIPPNILPRSLFDIKTIIKLLFHLFINLKSTINFLFLMTQSASSILNQWFECDELKGVLATDGIIGAMASPKTKGTGYILLHHVMGKVTNQTGVWTYVEGGMGGLIDALTNACLSLNVTIKTVSEVSSIDVSSTFKKVILNNGDFYESPIVISNLDPYLTSRLIDKAFLPKKYLRNIEKIDFSSPVVKINVHLSAMPKFKALHGLLKDRDLQGTIHLNPLINDLDESYQEAQNNRFSTKPLIEITLPSVIDKTLTPKGEHVMGIFSQYAPYNLLSEHWNKNKLAYVNHIFNLIEHYCPQFKSLIIDYEALCPRDLQHIYSLTNGNIFHGAMTFNQLFSFRPVRGFANYTTPIKGLYICGSGTHPGGGVTGIPGFNAAKKIIHDTIK